MVMRALKLYFHKILPQAIDEDSLCPKWYHQAFSNESIDVSLTNEVFISEPNWVVVR